MYSASSSTRSILSNVVCVNFMLLKVTTYDGDSVQFYPQKGDNQLGILTAHPDHRNDHFFQADAAMLKGVPVIIHVIVVIVGVTEEPIAAGKNKGRVDRGDGQTG